MTDVRKFAEVVDEAARSAVAIPQFTEQAPLSVADAYAIQSASIERRLQRGEKLVGVKMGLTSRAKMAQVKVDEVVWGRLTDAMRLEEGASLSRRRYVHPRIEPELAFLLKAPLTGVVTAAEAMAAVGGIAPAMEIIDFALPELQVRPAGRHRRQFLVVELRRRQLVAPGSGLLQSGSRDGSERPGGRDRLDGGDPRQSLALARRGGSPCRRGARSARSGLDHSRRRCDGRAFAASRRARATHACRISDRFRSA